MTKKHWMGQVMLCVAVVLLSFGTAGADTCPVTQGDVHYDPLQGAGVWWTMTEGTQEGDDFSDDLDDSNTPWVVELELRNETGGEIVLPIVIFIETLNFNAAGYLTIPDGETRKFFISDSETHELHGHRYSAMSQVTDEFLHDCSVVEGTGNTTFPGGWVEAPMNEIISQPHVMMQAVELAPSDVPAVSQLGMIIMALLLVAAGMMVIRQRRSGLMS